MDDLAIWRMLIFRSCWCTLLVGNQAPDFFYPETDWFEDVETYAMKNSCFSI